jgi:hypothetical protein
VNQIQLAQQHSFPLMEFIDSSVEPLGSVPEKLFFHNLISPSPIENYQVEFLLFDDV